MTQVLVTCPCQHFTSLDAVAAVVLEEGSDSRRGKVNLDKNLSQTPSLDHLVSWLSGRFEAENETKCADKGRCSVQRGKISLLCLNALRDACRIFLSNDNKATVISFQRPAAPSTPNVSSKKETKLPTTRPSYEEEFPTLTSTGNKALVSAKPKAKRRIRPATVALSSSGETSMTLGNLVNIPSISERLKVASDSGARIMNNFATTVTTQSTPQKEKVPPVVSESRAWIIQSPPAKSDLKATSEPTVEQLESYGPLLSLIQIYCTLIQSNLVPSTPLELQFLVRLLVIDSHCTASPQESMIFGGIMSSPHRCKFFGVRSLRQLEGAILGLFGSTTLLGSIISCPPIHQNCPDLVQALVEAHQQHTTKAKHSGRDGTSTSALLIWNRVAHYSVPFNQSRDSRHNFKTRDEQAIYKNREETRDIFLSQLRAFLSMRGRVADKAQTDMQMSRIESTCRHMVSNMKPGNFGWFAEFFCDMLLQLGLVPPEETDQSLLKITNHDKLQKLHQRFSSKSSNFGSSTRKFVDESKIDTSSPEAEAQLLFPGHQEFFYLFLLSTDAHRLAGHLISKIASILIELSLKATSNDIERRFLEMCMLARFLGYLTFSPNWQSSSVSTRSVKSGYCGLNQLDSVGIRPITLVQDAWVNHRLIAVIPWIVDLLKLAKRDYTLRDSGGHQEIIGMLRQIQLGLWSRSNQEDSDETPALAVVKLSLETFVGEIVGFSRFAISRKLPEMTYNPTIALQANALDGALTKIDSQTIFAYSNHTQQFADLLAQLSRADVAASFRSPRASRKLRPSTLSSSLAIGSIMSPEQQVEPLQDHRSFSLTGLDSNPTKGRLQDAFFHQHRDIKDVCEFVAIRALRVGLLKLSDHARDVETYEDVYTEFRCIVEAHLKDSLQQSLELLVSNNSTLKKVLDVAVSLTAVRALESIDSVLRSKAAMASEGSGRGAGKQLFSAIKPEGNSLVRVAKSDANQTLIALTDAIEAFNLELDVPIDESSITVNRASLASILRCIDDAMTGNKRQIPGDNVLRALFQSILRLDLHAVEVMNWAIVASVEDATTRWPMVIDLLQVAIKIRHVSSHGLRTACERVSQSQFLLMLIELGLRTGASTESLTSLVSDLLDARLTTRRSVKNALSCLEATTDVRTRDVMVKLSETLALTYPILK